MCVCVCMCVCVSVCVSVCEQSKSWIVCGKPVYFCNRFLLFYISSYLLYCLNNMSTVIGLHSQKKNLNHQKFHSRYLEIILLSVQILYLFISSIICTLVVLVSLLSLKLIFMQIISTRTCNGISIS